MINFSHLPKHAPKSDRQGSLKNVTVRSHSKSPERRVLARRSTCPNVNLVAGGAFRGDLSRAEQPAESVLRRPLSTLASLNTNLQRIFFKSFKPREGNEPKENLLDDTDSDDSFVSAVTQPDAHVRVFQPAVPPKKLFEEKLLYCSPYLHESVELQLRRTQRPPYNPNFRKMKLMRAAIIDWVFSLQIYFSLSDVVAHISIEILDRSMSTMQIQEKELQLAAGAAFWLAAKVEGFSIDDNKINARQIQRLLGKSCSVELLKRAEMKMFKSLGYRVPRDSVLSILNYQLYLLTPYTRVDSELKMIAHFVLDAGMLFWNFAENGTTRLASTATLLACQLSGCMISDRTWNQLASKHSFIRNKEDLEQTASSLVLVMMEVQGPKKRYSNLRAKYMSPAKGSIASNPKLSYGHLASVGNNNLALR